MKYAGAATVRLVEAGPGRVAVEILDEGPGIPEAERALMLQPFVRGDRARTLNEAGGFGLGLSIASAIAQSHGACSPWRTGSRTACACASSCRGPPAPCRASPRPKRREPHVQDVGVSRTSKMSA